MSSLTHSVSPHSCSTYFFRTLPLDYPIKVKRDMILRLLSYINDPKQAQNVKVRLASDRLAICSQTLL